MPRTKRTRAIKRCGSGPKSGFHYSAFIKKFLGGMLPSIRNTTLALSVLMRIWEPEPMLSRSIKYQQCVNSAGS